MNKTKMTPMNTWHHDHGAKMVEFAGWEMPIQYGTGILQEHLATRKHGGLFDVSHMSRFLIGGRDVVIFLQHVLTSNVEALRQGQAQYALICNERGGVIDDAYLYRFRESEFTLVVNAANAEKDLDYLRTQSRAIDHVTIEDITDSTSLIAFQDPNRAESWSFFSRRDFYLTRVTIL